MDRLTAETKPHRNGVIEGLRLRLWPRDVAGSMLVVWSGMVVWAVVFAGLAAARHAAFESFRFDLGNMTQAVWSTAHGRPLEMTDSAGEQIVRLGSHVDPLLMLFAPAWWVWPSPIMLTTAQALILASGALPVFWLARKHIGDDRAACNLALAYLLFPAVQWIALFDFHPVTLAVPLLLYMIWFLDEDRLLAATVFAVLAASSKEDIPLAIAGIGLWYAVRRHRPLVGWAMVVLGVAWTAVSLWIIVPHFGTGGPNPFYGRWESVGGSPSGIVKTLFTDPGQIWHEATTGKDLLYLFLLFVPFLFLWAFEPLLVVAALPILALNLLSTFPSMNSIRYQYVSAIVACVFAATAIGAGRLGPQRARVATLGVMGLIAALWLFGPLGFGGSWKYISDLRTPSARLEAAREAVKLIPPSAAVSASNSIGAHLSERRRIFLFPVRADADWVVVDKTDPWLALTGEADDPVRYNAELGQLRRDRRWRLVFDDDGVLVYKRVAARLSPS